jgi:hypothetical protein
MGEDGAAEGKSLGVPLGTVLGDVDGRAEGKELGVAEGEAEGKVLGDTEGDGEGISEGKALALLGEALGDAEGKAEGEAEGRREGLELGGFDFFDDLLELPALPISSSLPSTTWVARCLTAQTWVAMRAAMADLKYNFIYRCSCLSVCSNYENVIFGAYLMAKGTRIKERKCSFSDL